MADLSLTVIPNALAGLHALQTPDLDVCTVAQAYEWATEELNRLSSRFGLFFEHADAVAAGAGQFVFPLPAGHIATVQAEYNNRVLRAATVHELEAGDPVWEDAASFPPSRYVADWQATDTIRLYPIPNLAGLWALLYQLTPPSVSAASPNVTLAAPVADVLTLRVIAEARRRETDSQMPETVAACEQLIGLYESAMHSYYGGGL